MQSVVEPVDFSRHPRKDLWYDHLLFQQRLKIRVRSHVPLLKRQLASHLSRRHSNYVGRESNERLAETSSGTPIPSKNWGVAIVEIMSASGRVGNRRANIATTARRK